MSASEPALCWSYHALLNWWGRHWILGMSYILSPWKKRRRRRRELRGGKRGRRREKEREWARESQKAKELNFMKNGWVCLSPLTISDWTEKNSRPRLGRSHVGGSLFHSLCVGGKSPGPESEELTSVPALLLTSQVTLNKSNTLCEQRSFIKSVRDIYWRPLLQTLC